MAFIQECIFCFQNQTPVWKSGIAYRRLCTCFFFILPTLSFDKGFKGLIQSLMRGILLQLFQKLIFLVSFQVIWQRGISTCEKTGLLVKWDVSLGPEEMREASVPCPDRLHVTLNKSCINRVLFL